MRISDWSSDVCSSDLFAGEGVDDDLRGSGAVGIVVERPALAGLAVPMDLRRLVKAGGGQGDARHVGRLDEVGEDDLLIADAQEARQELDLGFRDAPVLGGEVDKPDRTSTRLTSSH